MATSNTSGDHGFEDLCTLYPEEREPLMSAEDHKLVKKRKHLGDSLPVTLDPDIANRRPRSVPPTEVVKVLKERDIKYQSQPVDLNPNYLPVDGESLRRGKVEKPLFDADKLRKEKQKKFKSKSVEMSDAWYPMGDEGGYQPRPSAREDPRGDRKPYQSMPMLNTDRGYEPGPSRGEDTPRQDRRRQYQSGSHIDTTDDPYRGYDRRGSPKADRRQSGHMREEDNEYYRERDLSRDDIHRRYESDRPVDMDRNYEPQGGLQGDGRMYQSAHGVDYRKDRENNNVSGRREYQLSEVFPSINSADGKGTLIRHRRKSSRKSGFGEPDYDDEEEVDGKTLPSQKAIQRNRTKSIKERKRELEEEKKTNPKPKSLAEKYNELKDRGNITAGDVATIVRESTMTRMNKVVGGKESKKWHRFKLKKKEFLDRFTIWAGTLKEVEGEYGTAVMTYFRFIKWLMFLNIYIMIIMFCVITVPYLALGPGNFNSSLTDVNVSGYREAISCTTQYEVYHKNLTDSESLGQQVLDFLQGTGWMERKVLFYGVYFNKTYTTSDNDTYTYHMGLAYMLAFGACFLVSFLLIVKNASKNVKVSLGSTDTVAVYSNKIMCGWDFCISKGKAAKVKKRNIFTDLKAELNDQRKEWRMQERSTTELAQLYLVRILINFLVLALLGGALYLITFTAEQMIELQNERTLSEILELLVQYVPFVTITVLNAVLPIIFQKLVQFEDYRYEFGFKLTLARAILLRLASPIALIAILYKELIEMPEENAVDGQCGNKQWQSDARRGRIMCWETYFGQQLYKLVLLDLIVETGIIFFMQIPRWYIHKKYGKSSDFVKLVGPQEFDLPQSVVDIIYTQSICWLGMFFSPLIPFMTFVKCVLFFWVKKFAVLKINVPQERPFKTSGSNSLFMLVLLLSFIIAAGMLGYMIGNIPPSQSCGPFRVYSNQTGAAMFDVITNTVYSWPTEARDVFEFLGTVGFFLPVVILLVLVMYYYWLRGQGYKKTEELLQNQLKLEGRDKKYLLDRVNEVLQQNSDLLS